MSQSRIEAFEEMVKEQPDDAMIWYGLATEYGKLSDWSKATNALRNVIRCNPDYTAAYQMLGTALQNLGDIEEARRVWMAGIEAATRTGAWKARGHMEGLLAQMKTDSDTEFCS